MAIDLIFIAGQQGCGKTHHGKELANQLDYAYCGTGDLLRAWAEKNPQHEIAINLSKGILAPSNFVDKLFRESVIKAKKNFVADGYPRTTSQAQVCYELVCTLNVTLILLQAPEETLRSRLLNRNRSDDSPESIERRFESWRDVEEPAFNTLKNLLNVEPIIIDSSGEKEDTWAQIRDSLKLPGATL